MAVRLQHGAIALGFGAADALVTSQVKQAGPGGISIPVYLEIAGVVAGMFGDRLGLDADIRDPVLLSSLALAGARLTRAAAAGKLMAGPKAWGGDTGGDMLAGVAAGGAPSLPGRPIVRMLPGRSAVGGTFSLYPAQQEAPGVAG